MIRNFILAIISTSFYVLVIEELNQPPVKKVTVASILKEISMSEHINLDWQGQLEKVYVGYHTKFADIINQIAEQKHCKPGSIVLMLGDKVIQRCETPFTIRYHISKFITGRTVPGLDISDNFVKPINKDMLKVKVLFEGKRKPEKFYIDKTQNFTGLFAQCAAVMKMDEDQLKIKFDGESINETDTPEVLNIESGDLFECTIVQ